MADLKITAAELRELRDATGCGLFEAKMTITKTRALRMLDDAKTLDDIKPIIAKLIEFM